MQGYQWRVSFHRFCPFFVAPSAFFSLPKRQAGTGRYNIYIQWGGILLFYIMPVWDTATYSQAGPRRWKTWDRWRWILCLRPCSDFRVTRGFTRLPVVAAQRDTSAIVFKHFLTLVWGFSVWGQIFLQVRIIFTLAWITLAFLNLDKLGTMSYKCVQAVTMKSYQPWIILYIVANQSFALVQSHWNNW